jgi:hypothetical protein
MYMDIDIFYVHVPVHVRLHVHAWIFSFLVQWTSFNAYFLDGQWMTVNASSAVFVGNVSMFNV